MVSLLRKTMVGVWDCGLGFCWVLSLPIKEHQDLSPTSHDVFGQIALSLPLMSPVLVYQ